MRTHFPALLLCCTMLAAAGPGPRAASAEERNAIVSSIDHLILAANQRDVAGVRAVTMPGFAAIGDSWAFVAEGYPRWANRTAEIPQARIAAVVRSVTMLANDIATAEGFFRTSKLDNDLAGDFNGTVLRRDGRWLVAAIRFAPLRFEAPYQYPIRTVHTGRAQDTDGWMTLFDGKSLEAFGSMDGGPAPPSWSVEDGVLRLTPESQRPQGGFRGLRTRETYTSFELEFEWKIGANGNSGVKYALCYLTGGDGAGREYQVVDDDGDHGAIRDARERSGALYAQIAPTANVVRPLGEFNHSTVLVRGRHCEHWLNGTKVVEYESAFEPLESPIVFQNHSTPVWFRRIRIRRLNP